MIAIVTIAVDESLRGKALPSGVIWGTYWVQSVDGRRAMPYEFSEEDQAFLQQQGAVLVDALPADFVLPKSEP